MVGIGRRGGGRWLGSERGVKTRHWKEGGQKKKRDFSFVA